MSDLTKILPENQKEIFKLIAPLSKKRSASVNIQASDSEPENVSVTRTSTPVKTNTATGSKTTPINSRNIVYLGNVVFTEKLLERVASVCNFQLQFSASIYFSTRPSLVFFSCSIIGFFLSYLVVRFFWSIVVFFLS